MAVLMHLDAYVTEELARTDTTLKRDNPACSIWRDHPIPSYSNPNTFEFGIDPFHPLWPPSTKHTDD
jgi:hypothetical protein